MSGEKESKAGAVIVTDAGSWDIIESAWEIEERKKNSQRGMVAATLTNGIKVNFVAENIKVMEVEA